MCNCKYGKETVMVLPDDIATHRINRTVAIDSCIVEDMKRLWDKGIQTLGCCCGHNKENLSVVVAEGYTDDEIQNIIYPILGSERKWDVFQWRIKKIARKD